MRLETKKYLYDVQQAQALITKTVLQQAAFLSAAWPT